MHKPLLGVTILLALTMPPALAGGEEEYQKGLAAYKARSYRTAAKHFEDSLAGGNGAAEVYIYMAHSYAASGDIKKAVQIYRDTARIFAGLPAETMAKKCIARLDPQNRIPAKISEEERKEAEKQKPKLSFIHRVNIIAPTIPGHQPVSPSTVGKVKQVIARLPRWVYLIADQVNATINIGPNFTDRWPETLQGSTPGMEHERMADALARTYGNDIYLFERPTIDGTTRLGPIVDYDALAREVIYQVSHIIDSGLGIMEDKRFRAEYDLDKKAIPPEKEGELRYYLQADYVGSGEVIASVIANVLGNPGNSKVEENFPRAAAWVRKRVATASAAATSIAKRNPSKTEVKTFTQQKDEPEKKEPAAPADVIPDEEHVPYWKDLSGKPMVNALINARRIPVMIDTGAFRTVIGVNHLKTLGLPLPEGKSIPVLYGAAGAVKGWKKNYEIAIGKIKRTTEVTVLDDHERTICIGQPFLRGMHYRVDPKRNYIHFVKDSKTIEKQVSVDSIEIPFRMSNDNIIVQAKINGHLIEMNFDTGAPMILIDTSDAKKIGLHKIQPLAITNLGGHGSGHMRYYVYNLSRVELGSMLKTDLKGFVPANGGVGSVLGQSFFGTKTYVIDNQKNVIRFSR